MKTFTDEEGNKYEGFEYPTTHDKVAYSIQRVDKPVEKLTIRIRVDNYYGEGEYSNRLLEDITGKQAMAVAQAVESLIEYIQTPLDHVDVLKALTDCEWHAKQARDAMQASQDNE